MALLPPFFLDTVVAIGVGADPAKRQWVGTGFIYGLRVPSPGKEDYQLFLISNKHVYREKKEVFVKFNSALDKTSKDYRAALLSRNGKPRWIGHPDAKVDVAALWLNADFLSKEARQYEYFRSDTHIMNCEAMRKSTVTEGDRVFVLGFPMGMVSPERQYVICRGGVIARIRDFLDGRASDFLVDSTVFPGNSGGPVIICPSALAITGTSQIKKADLVGIVKSYVPYNEVAVSPQTGKPRMMFEENSGLTAVESADAIAHTVKLAARRLKIRRTVATWRARRAASAQTQAQLPPQPQAGLPPVVPVPQPPEAPPPEPAHSQTSNQRAASCRRGPR